jgi:hypothetical protein
MPLPVKSRFFICYLVQPRFCQQLGIFSSKTLNNIIGKKFLKKINSFPSVRLMFNEEYYLSEKSGLTSMDNYVLSLNHSFEELQSTFSENTNRNIKKAVKNEIKIEQISIKDFFSFVSANASADVKKIIPLLQQITYTALEKDVAILLGAYNSEGKLVAANLLLNKFNRIVNLFPISSIEGKEKSAMFLLMTDLIKQYSGTDIILDFEGSIIPSVARFYKGFGSTNKPYFFYKKSLF